MSIARAIAVLALAAPAATRAAAHDYRLDTVHTQVTASASHLGFSQPGGRLHVTGGWFRFDPDDWSTAQVDVTLDATSIDFGNAGWNDKLRSREFLDAAHHPTVRFVADKIEKTGEKTGVAHGKLTLLGLTRPLDLAITLNRVAVHAFTFKWTAGFHASAQFKRSQFRMTKYLPDVGDEVSIQIEAEGIRDAEARKAMPATNSASPDDTKEP